MAAILLACVEVTIPGTASDPDDASGIDTAGLVGDDGALARLADRLAFAQNDDGSWDWQRPYADPLTPETTGYQNVTGVTALGFRPVLARLGENPGWSEAEAKAIAYFEAKLPALEADPSQDANVLSAPAWTLLAGRVDGGAALDALILRRDELHGADDGRLDGWVNYNVSRRAGVVGIIPWDLALFAEAIQATAAVDAAFAPDHVEICSRLAAYLEETFLPAWQADRGMAYGDISIAHPLSVLADCEDVSAELLATLDAELEAQVHDDGSVGNGANGDGPHQAAAYGLLALKRRGSPLADLVQAHAEGLVGQDGMLADDGSGVETYEIAGEVLRALAE